MNKRSATVHSGSFGQPGLRRRIQRSAVSASAETSSDERSQFSRNECVRHEVIRGIERNIRHLFAFQTLRSSLDVNFSNQDLQQSLWLFLAISTQNNTTRDYFNIVSSSLKDSTLDHKVQDTVAPLNVPGNQQDVMLILANARREVARSRLALQATLSRRSEQIFGEGMQGNLLYWGVQMLRLVTEHPYFKLGKIAFSEANEMSNSERFSGIPGNVTLSDNMVVLGEHLTGLMLFLVGSGSLWGDKNALGRTIGFQALYNTLSHGEYITQQAERIGFDPLTVYEWIPTLREVSMQCLQLSVCMVIANSVPMGALLYGGSRAFQSSARYLSDFIQNRRDAPQNERDQSQQEAVSIILGVATSYMFIMTLPYILDYAGYYEVKPYYAADDPKQLEDKAWCDANESQCLSLAQQVLGVTDEMSYEDIRAVYRTKIQDLQKIIGVTSDNHPEYVEQQELLRLAMRRIKDQLS